MQEAKQAPIDPAAMDAYLEKAAVYNKMLNIKGAGLAGARRVLKPKKIGNARKLKEANRRKAALAKTMNKIDFAKMKNK